MILRILFFLIFFGGALCLPSAFKRWTCSFRSVRCMPPPSEGRGVLFSKLKSDAVTQILSNPFHYLDRGAQSFVFASEDGLYVLKLFFFDSSIEKANKLLQSCTFAAKAPEETGLIYLHFGPSKEPLPLLQLVGPAWRRTRLAGAEYCFALQKRAVLLDESLSSAYRAGDRDAFVKRIDALFDLLQRRISMGICNSDRSLYRNFGFVDAQAIEIDFGHYAHDAALSEEAKMREIARCKKRLGEWASREMPEWRESIVAMLNSKEFSSSAFH